jgi:hypothetical protein
MKNNNLIALSILIGALALTSTAFAHGTEMHDKMATPDARMQKLHAMMPVFSVAVAGLESALEKGQVKDAETEAKRILVAIPDLKASMPHKNLKQLKKYVGLATTLEQTVTSSVDLAKKGDFAGARETFRKIEETCAACHAKFRD